MGVEAPYSNIDISGTPSAAADYLEASTFVSRNLILQILQIRVYVLVFELEAIRCRSGNFFLPVTSPPTAACRYQKLNPGRRTVNGNVEYTQVRLPSVLITSCLS